MQSSTEEYFEVVTLEKEVICKSMPTQIAIQEKITRIDDQHVGIVCLLEVTK